MGLLKRCRQMQWIDCARPPGGARESTRFRPQVKELCGTQSGTLSR
jgi:hypothetical protein